MREKMISEARSAWMSILRGVQDGYAFAYSFNLTEAEYVKGWVRNVYGVEV